MKTSGAILRNSSHQSSAVMPRWHILDPAEGRWSVDIVLSIDTSAAQARELGEAPALAHA